jgi:hypothetical protein
VRITATDCLEFRGQKLPYGPPKGGTPNFTLTRRIDEEPSTVLAVGLVTVSSLLFLAESLSAQSRKITALVGGTLIDGYGSRFIRNSVILIEGERIKVIGQVGSLAIPSGVEIIFTEGMASNRF